MASKVDLDTCDREPIHYIGAVQPHGALIAVQASTLEIDYVSQNCAEFLGAEPEMLLGAKLPDVIGQDNVDQLLAMPLQPSEPHLLRPWYFDFAAPCGKTISVECLPHRNNGLIILEFLRPEAMPATVWEDELLRRDIINELVKPGDLHELANASAHMIRDVTGFDRVMIYKFAEDKHGEVIAESTNRPDSFLGLHYPASDIPDPARRHFTLNVMRSIPDINGAHIPIVGRTGEVADAEAAEPLDLTYAKLRAVAPVHVQYLNNMGVGASLSISLITNNQLWGLVACHHYSTRLISSSRLRFAELLGSTTSALLQSIENTTQLRKSIQAEKTAFRIEQQARDGSSLQSLVRDYAPELMQMIDAQGLMLVLGDRLLRLGDAPRKTFDISSLRQLSDDGVAVSSELSQLVEMTKTERRSVAGAALLELSDDGADYLLFLRNPFHQTIRWAGKPEKIETTDDDGVTRLSPRGSFALFSEERRGQSRPFDLIDRDALRILRRALFALNSIERERAALEAQKAAEAEKLRLRHALLDAARASSMGELASAIAHELNQPLSAVANYVSACQQELINSGIAIPDAAMQLMEDAKSESERAGELVRRVRDFISRGDLNAEYIDLNEAIKEGVDLALVSSILPKLHVNLILDRSLPKILADKVQIAQVVLNLARNAITAMEARKKQVLTIEVTQSKDTVKVWVRDTGPGIAPEQHNYLFEPFHTFTGQGMGIGLSLCRSIIEAHSGRIWLHPSSSGATFVFELPLRADQHD